VLQVDSDRQFDLDDFWRLWDARSDAELVVGVRQSRQGPRHRVLLARLLSLLVSVLIGARLSDPNTPFRVFRRSLWQELEPLFPREPLIPSILLSTAAALASRRIAEVPVRHRPRRHGRSSLRRGHLLVFCLRALHELAAYRGRVALRGARQGKATPNC
jgi:hypothetical protein